MTNIEVASAENVAKRLIWVREFIGLSQKEFAASIGVQPALMNNWERGRHRLSLEGALKINAVYGTTLDFLYLNRRSSLPVEMAKALSSSSDLVDDSQ